MWASCPSWQNTTAMPVSWQMGGAVLAGESVVFHQIAQNGAAHRGRARSALPWRWPPSGPRAGQGAVGLDAQVAHGGDNGFICNFTHDR